MDAFAAIRLAAGVAFLATAAASDVRTRRVRDPLWIVLGTLGLVLVLLELGSRDAGLERLALVPATAVLFYAIFFGRPIFDEDGVHVRPVRMAAFAAAAGLVVWSASSAFGRGGAQAGAYAELLTMPAMVLVFQGFYHFGLLHGGADAKGLIALTLLVPTYPDAAPFPLLAADPRVAPTIRVLFPFSLVVLVDAAILFLLVPLALLVGNALRGDLRFPQAFVGYRARLDPMPRHVWLMEKIDATGERVLVLFPRRGREDAAADRLRAAGVRKAWVQPKVPFMVPMAVGFALAFLVGNLLLAVLGAAR